MDNADHDERLCDEWKGDERGGTESDEDENMNDVSEQEIDGDFDESENSDCDDIVGRTLSAAVPSGMVLLPHIPRLGSKLKNSEIVMRWDVGWFHGIITHFFTATERKKLPVGDRSCNFEIQWTGEPGYDNQLLVKENYSIAENRH
jgi:hypothetical protein